MSTQKIYKQPKNFDSCPPARTSQADMGRYFLVVHENCFSPPLSISSFIYSKHAKSLLPKKLAIRFNETIFCVSSDMKFHIDTIKTFDIK